jgi:hypothetical protein
MGKGGKVASKKHTETGLDHRVGHFRPLRIIAQVLEPVVLSTVRRFCVVQKQKGVAGAMIKAQKPIIKICIQWSLKFEVFGQLTDWGSAQLFSRA